MSAISINFSEFVQIQNTQPVTNSKFVAKAFDKRHDNVLAKIDELLTQVPDYFKNLNFKEIEISRMNSLGRTVKDKAYELTKDGFMLLVMGFTGKAAMQIKIAYIEAFNSIAEKLRQLTVSGSLKISPAQKLAIREAVQARHHRTGEHWQEIYKKLHGFLKVNSYHEIEERDFQTALDFLASIENAPAKPEQTGVCLTEQEISQFAVVTCYLDKATRQLKDLSEPLKAIGARQQGVEARTLWLESQSWLRHSRAALERMQPQIKDNYFREHTAETLCRMDSLACII